MKRLIKLIGISIVFGVFLSVIANWHLNNRYEISDSITLDKIENKYGPLINEIEALYKIEDKSLLSTEVKRILEKMPLNEGILELSQQDKGKVNTYGVDYFYFQKNKYVHSYVYRNSDMRDAGGLMRGYVETESGNETDILQYEKLISIENEKLEIKLVLDYEYIEEIFNQNSL